MKNKEFQKMLYKAAARLPASAVIAMRVLADKNLQRILKKGGTGRPVIIIYGEPGNGKTSTVEVLLEECREIKFADGLKAVKKAIGGMADAENVQILFLDNFPQVLSAYRLEAGRRMLDYVIDITSEDPEAPLAIITGEPNIIGEVKRAGYLIGRSLVIRMPKIDDDEDLYSIRRYFSLNRPAYLEHWRAYDNWLERNPAGEADVLQELGEFREKYCEKYENRKVGLVFCYYYAMCRYSGFLESEYGEAIPIEAIRKNVQMLFEWEESPGSRGPSYEVNVWNEFVGDGGICRISVPDASVCQCLAKTDCGRHDAPYQCHTCWDADTVEKYNPMDLRLTENTDAILIEKPRLIPGFPRHVVCGGPLLMIKNQSLLEMLNTYLEAYSRKKRASVRRITPKRLTKELFSHNLCLFEYVGTGHNTYTFRMKDADHKDIRVIFIKLTTGQYRQLKDVAKKPLRIKNYSMREVIEMNGCLKYFCENVQSLIGDIGMPSMVLDETD